MLTYDDIGTGLFAAPVAVFVSTYVFAGAVSTNVYGWLFLIAWKRELESAPSNWLTAALIRMVAIALFTIGIAIAARIMPTAIVVTSSITLKPGVGRRRRLEDRGGSFVGLGFNELLRKIKATGPAISLLALNDLDNSRFVLICRRIKMFQCERSPHMEFRLFL